MSRFRPRTLLLLGLVSALVACTPTSPPTADPSSSTAPPRLAETLWTARASLVGWPEVSGETVVSYLQDSKGLQVAAWDLGTGKRLWLKRADPGHGTSGVMIDIDLVTRGGTTYVAYLVAASAKDWQQVVVANARTGKMRWLDTNFVWATSRPEACADGKAFCLTGYRFADEVEVSLRVDPATRKLRRDRSTGLPSGAQLLGEHVFATDDREPEGTEYLGWAEDGKVAWRRPYSDVFGPGTTSDAGWNWDDEAGQDVVIGTGWPRDHLWDDLEASAEAVEDTSLVRTVGLDRRTGRTLWSLDGVDRCDFAALHGEEGQPAVLCRIKAGTANWKQVGSSPELSETGHDVDLIGIDPATGAQLWSVPLGADGFDFTEGDAWFPPRESIVVPRGDGAVRVDRTTGAVTPVAADELLPCLVDEPPFVRTIDGDRVRYQVGAATLPCDASRTKSDHWTAAAVEAVGVDAEAGRWVLPTREGLLVVRV